MCFSQETICLDDLPALLRVRLPFYWNRSNAGESAMAPPESSLSIALTLPLVPGNLHGDEPAASLRRNDHSELPHGAAQHT
jgi:hypothetical protein